MLKSQEPFPSTPWFPRGTIDLAAERQTALQRLVPLVAFYSSFTLLVVGMAMAYAANRPLALAFFVLGVALWTPLEYFVHRRVLHGPFPDGPGFFQHLLHKQFDHLHAEHHLKPWSGKTISGSLDQTLPVVFVLAALSLLAPPYTLLLTVAGIAQSYVVEECIHYSVHFESYKSRYFRYIKKHHLYHHSPRGAEVGFGLTSGIWDIVFDTRLPEDARALLYPGKKATKSEVAAPPAEPCS
jgi:4-hydroxysphinganine ceramide fatty acyl 2-hydroxylase